MTVQDKRLTGIILGTGILLLIPLIAMQCTDEVSWSTFDFAVAAGLLLGAGLTCELVLRKVTKPTHRVALCLAVLAVLVLVWAEMAVGAFGTPLAGN